MKEYSPWGVHFSFLAACGETRGVAAFDSNILNISESAPWTAYKPIPRTKSLDVRPSRLVSMPHGRYQSLNNLTRICWSPLILLYIKQASKLCNWASFAADVTINNTKHNKTKLKRNKNVEIYTIHTSYDSICFQIPIANQILKIGLLVAKPDPVTAQAQRSLPLSATGIQADCIGVGCTNCMELNALTRGRDKLMSENVNLSSYVSMDSSNFCFSG